MSDPMDILLDQTMTTAQSGFIWRGNGTPQATVGTLEQGMFDLTRYQGVIFTVTFPSYTGTGVVVTPAIFEHDTYSNPLALTALNELTGGNATFTGTAAVGYIRVSAGLGQTTASSGATTGATLLNCGKRPGPWAGFRIFVTGSLTLVSPARVQIWGWR